MTEPDAPAEVAKVGDPPAAASLLWRFLGRPGGAAGLALVSSVAVVGLVADRLVSADPRAMANPTFVAPSRRFPMGTNAVGQDMFSRVVHGIATSLTVMVGVMVISTVIGVTLGAVAGYRGGLLDSLVMRVVDMMQSVPGFLLAIVVVALIGSGYDKLILLLGLTSWTFLARLVRAEVLSVKQREFVESARSMGAPNGRILLHHVLPNVIPSVVVVLPLMASRIVLIEAGLAFLGLGDRNRVSLGSLISEAQPYLQYYWWLSVFPGAVLVALVLGLNLMGDALNDALNPGRGAGHTLGRLRRGRSAGADPAPSGGTAQPGDPAFGTAGR